MLVLLSHVSLSLLGTQSNEEALLTTPMHTYQSFHITHPINIFILEKYRVRKNNTKGERENRQKPSIILTLIQKRHSCQFVYATPRWSKQIMHRHLHSIDYFTSLFYFFHSFGIDYRSHHESPLLNHEFHPWPSIEHFRIRFSSVRCKHISLPLKTFFKPAEKAGWSFISRMYNPWLHVLILNFCNTNDSLETTCGYITCTVTTASWS